MRAIRKRELGPREEELERWAVQGRFTALRRDAHMVEEIFELSIFHHVDVKVVKVHEHAQLQTVLSCDLLEGWKVDEEFGTVLDVVL